MPLPGQAQSNSISPQAEAMVAGITAAAPSSTAACTPHYDIGRIARSVTPICAGGWRSDALVAAATTGLVQRKQGMARVAEESGEGEQEPPSGDAPTDGRDGDTQSPAPACYANESKEEDREQAAGTGSMVLMSPLSTEALMLRELELAPVAMHPQQVSRATEIRLFLAHIESIEIQDVIERDEGVIYYVLDVYLYRQQKGLPTTRGRRKSSLPPPLLGRPRLTSTSSPLGTSQCSASACGRAPDYRVEQRYSSFSRLRSNVAHIARKHHPKRKPCAYCAGLLDFLHVTPCKPSLKVKFTTTTEERKHILGSFINDLVFAAREDYTACPRSLRGYHIIPALVKRFLSEQTGNNFFS